MPKHDTPHPLLHQARRAAWAPAALLFVAALALALTGGRAVPVAVLWLAACAELGRRTVVALRIRPSLALSAATGVGLLSLVLVLAALAGAYHPAWLAAMVIAAAGSFVLRRGWRDRLPVVDVLSAGGAALVLLAALTVSLLPVTSYDARVYHLALPEVETSLHHLVNLPENVYSHFPRGLELHFGLLLVWGGRAAPAVFHLLLGFAVLAGVLGCGLDSAEDRRPGALALLGSSAFWLAAAIPNVDMGPVLFGTAAVCLLLPAGATRRHATLAGALLGAALAAKFSSAGLLVLPLLVLALLAAPSWRAGLARCLWMLPGILLLPLPYLLRNAALEGNPFFPLLCGVFGSRTWGPEQITVFDQYVLQHAGLAGLWQALVPDGFAKLREVRQSIAFVFLLPLALVALRKQEGRALVAALLVGAAAFAWGSRGEMRFILPLLPLLALASSVALAAADSPRARRLLVVLLALQVPLGAWYTSRPGMHDAALGWHAGRLDRREYGLASGHPGVVAVEMLGELPDVSRVLFAGAAGSFGAEVPVVAPTVFDPHPLIPLSESHAGGRSLAADLRARGFSHILVDDGELGRLEQAFAPLGWKDGGRLTDALRKLVAAGCLAPVYQPPGYPGVVVYRIRESQ